jgi:hypothetical protein
VKARFGVAAAALLMWILFTLGTIVICALQPFAIVLWAVTGNQFLRGWVYRTGKGTDQVNNAGWFAGDHKETISSHVGKRYYQHFKFPTNLYAPTPAMRVVRWLTDKFEPQHVFKAIELQPGEVFTPEQKQEAIGLAQKGRILI